MSLAQSTHAAGQPRPGWLFLLSSRWLCWHAFAVVAFFGMLWLGDWQLHRAESGNELSWAYTFEWPLFAVFVVIFWARTVRAEVQLRTHGGQAGPDGEPDTDRQAESGPAALAGPGPDGAALAGGLPAPGDADEAARAAHLELLMAEVRRHRQRRAWR
jgi:hypothetical protein